MKPPSSTITWATIAGMAAAMCWELVDTFTAFEPTAGLVGGSTALVAGVIGKLVKEKRYTMTLNPK
jgi:hypothetical protein